MRFIKNLAWCGLVAWCGLLTGVQAEPLRVGFGIDRPPYVVEKNRSGLEVEIVTRAAAKANMQVVPVFANRQRTERMLMSGDLQAETITRPTANNRNQYFSQPYVEYQDAAFALAARKLNIRSIADLGKYRVASFPQARQLLGPEFQAMAAANPEYREYVDEQLRTLLLFNGDTDLLVGDRYIFSYFKQKLPEVSLVNIAQPVSVFALWAPVPFHVRFMRADLRDRFDQGLKALRQSGEYAAILKKYE